MRIDDEKKVVWCSEPEMSWYTSFNLSVGNHTFLNLRRINTLSTEKEVLLPSYMTITDRVEIIRAISDNYKFKLEQPQKYYWRKKKEHTVAFEENVWLSLNTVDERVYLYRNCTKNNYNRTYFTVQEARDLLKDDFDKFEKVECD